MGTTQTTENKNQPFGAVEPGAPIHGPAPTPRSARNMPPLRLGFTDLSLSQCIDDEITQTVSHAVQLRTHVSRIRHREATIESDGAMEHIANMPIECDDVHPNEEEYASENEEIWCEHRIIEDTNGQSNACNGTVDTSTDIISEHNQVISTPDNDKQEAEILQDDYCDHVHVEDTRKEQKPYSEEVDLKEVSLPSLSPAESTRLQFSRFLQRINMSQYEQKFEENECFDMECVQYFDDDFLKNDIGIHSIVLRKKMLAKCEQLKVDMHKFQRDYVKNQILHERLTRYGIVTLGILCDEIKQKSELQSKYAISNPNQCDLLWNTIQQAENQQCVEGL